MRRVPGLWLLICVQAAALSAADEPPPTRGSVPEFDPQANQWVEVAAPQAGTPQGDLALARRQLSEDHLRRARKALRQWLKNYGEDHPLARQAKLSLAECEHARREYYRAQQIADEVTVAFGSDEITQRALELRFNVAEIFLAGTKRKWLGMRILPASDLGIEILDKISGGYPDTTLAEQALKTKADYYFNRGDFDLAEDEYGRLVTAFPRSRWLPWARLRRAQAALARFPGTPFDDAPLIEAEERFLQYRDQFPQAAAQYRVDLILEDIRGRRAQKDLEIGLYYLKVTQVDAARFYFQMVSDSWAGTAAAGKAAARLAAMQPIMPTVPLENPQDGPDTAPENLE